MSALTQSARDAAGVGIAVALTLAATGAGYLAGKATADGFLARPAAEEIGDAHILSRAGAARVEGLLVLLLGRGGFR